MSDPKEAPILQTPRQPKYPEVGSAWTTGFLVVRQKPTFLRNLKPVPLYQKETFPLPLTEGPMAAFGAYLHIKAHAGISYLIHISKSLLASKPFLLHPKLPGAHRLPFHQLLFLITWLLLLCVLFPPFSQLALVTSSLLAMFSPLLFALDSPDASGCSLTSTIKSFPLLTMSVCTVLPWGASV